MHETPLMVRPRHMALAAVVIAIALLIGGAMEAEAATGASALPSPMLLLPVLLTFAARAWS